MGDLLAKMMRSVRAYRRAYFMSREFRRLVN